MSTADELVKLDALRQSGVLSQEEFNAEKAKLLAGILSSAGFGASQTENDAPAPSTCANHHPMRAEHAFCTKCGAPRAEPDVERPSLALDTVASTPTAQHRRVRVILVFCIALIVVVVSIVLVVSLSGGVNTNSISYKDGYAWAEGAWQNSCSVDGVSDPVLCEVNLTGSSPVTAQSLVSENCTGASMAIAEPSDNLDEWVAGCSAALQAAYNGNTGSADPSTAPATSVPPPTVPSTTVAVTPTTTTTVPTTTTTIATPVYGTPPELDSNGDLSIAGIPIVTIGEPKQEVVARLTAIFGPPQPEQDQCAWLTDERWGDLSLVFNLKKGTMVGFWYQDYTSTAPSPPLRVAGSGLTVFSTLAQAEKAYPNWRSNPDDNDLLDIPPAMNMWFGGGQSNGQIVAGNDVCMAPPG